MIMSAEKDLSEAELKEIGQRIQKRRKSCGLKQNELAEEIGISATHMSSIENGRQHPSVYVLLRISEYLNTTPDYFLLGNMRRQNVSQNITDALRLCKDKDLNLYLNLITLINEHFN